MAATRIFAAGGRTRQEHEPPAGRQDAGALDPVRDELERDPRDPFQVDPGRALDALRLEWGYAYRLDWHEGLYYAQRTGSGGKPEGAPLSGETPDELEQALRRDRGEE
jgi:hypothetical protein